MTKRGQSIIEYSLIAVLVIFGIVIMGPYVLRSVNAHFKLWDEGVKDSFDENITQAPLNDIPPINANCSCQDQPGQCGSAQAGSQCAGDERIYNHNCNPESCDHAPLSSCQYDTSCCTVYSKIGCGTIPIGQPLPTDNSNCHYGQAIEATQCSTLPIRCVTDSSCNPQCLGIASGDEIPCPGENTNLDQNYGITFLANKNQCNSSQKCQYYCKTGYCPAYSVTGIPSWGQNSLLNKGALWVAPDWDQTPTPPASPHDFLNQTTTYTNTVKILLTQTYMLRFSVASYGFVSIDGAIIPQLSYYSGPALYTQTPDYLELPTTLSKGNHTIAITATNTTPGGPAGVAFEILTLGSFGSVSALPTPIDTFPNEAYQWTSAVTCPTGLYWDCSKMSCTPTPPAAPNCQNCKIKPFRFIAVGWGGQTCGDGENASGTSGPVHPDLVCKTYGYGFDKFTSGKFDNECYGNDYFIKLTTAGTVVTPPCPTGTFPVTVNNVTACFYIGGCCYWGGIICSQASSIQPDNATSCVVNPINQADYYSIVKTCDGSTNCQSTCQPGYYTIFSSGPCNPNRCTGTIPDNAALCPGTALPALDNVTPYTFGACNGITPCQLSCAYGYTLDPITNTCTANSCSGILGTFTSSCNSNPPKVNHTSWTLTQDCPTNAQPCQAACVNDYYHPVINGIRSSCVQNSCGTVPKNALNCNLLKPTTDLPGFVLVGNSRTDCSKPQVACEAFCTGGTNLVNGSCQ